VLRTRQASDVEVLKTISLIRCEPGGSLETPDQVAVEEPLKIRLTRHLLIGSSCGLCGRATLDAVFKLENGGFSDVTRWSEE
jgi:formate dehydrogenase assembly factor FdhD